MKTAVELCSAHSTQNPGNIEKLFRVQPNPAFLIKPAPSVGNAGSASAALKPLYDICENAFARRAYQSLYQLLIWLSES